MISFEQAIEIVLKHSLPLPAEKTRVENAVGRVLLEDIRSGIDMPPFNKSAVDGYAVRSADLAENRELNCAGLIQAGCAFKGGLRRGECVKIMTGAPVPPGADAVVMVECTSERNGLVKFEKGIKKGANIALRGEDIKKGKKIFSRGIVISISHIAALAAVGRSHVKTGALPTVSLVNTGGEIVPPGAKLGKNHIYNSNGPMLSAMLKADGICVTPVIVPDDAKKMKTAIAKALKCDIALISGGVSMGDYDLVPGVLKSLGVKGLFHKVRVRPGKPMFFGVKGRKLVFGIPGNPVANFMAYLAYVRPAIRKLACFPDYAPQFQTGVCAVKFEPKTPRRALVLSTVRAKTNYLLAGVTNNGSADILALARADGFTMVKEGGSIKKKEKARFIAWQ
ncbi:MAG TPA: molybdopterin molybdenumtransferase MoeA [Elusimicrobia bacterium]|nr:molybdopterin molybdenumtransferase MoeA [Elusimicrobiota bacterium]